MELLLVYLCVARSYPCLGEYAGKKNEQKLVNEDSENFPLFEVENLSMLGSPDSQCRFCSFDH